MGDFDDRVYILEYMQERLDRVARDNLKLARENEALKHRINDLEKMLVQACEEHASKDRGPGLT